MARNSGRFHFDGGAATYVGTALLSLLITVVTLGICYPFALVLMERWKAKHSYIDGQRLLFTGSAVGLFGNWLKWFFLSVITLGIYLLWVGPRLTQWKWENTDFDPTWTQQSLVSASGMPTVQITNVQTSAEPPPSVGSLGQPTPLRASEEA